MSLADDLDALPLSQRRYPACEALKALDPAVLEAIKRNLKRGVTPAAMSRRLRAGGVLISEERFREHVKEVCPRCLISLAS